jgi:hypothetical protein
MRSIHNELVTDKIHVASYGWADELAKAFASGLEPIRIICPFIKHNALNRFITLRRCQNLRLITRLNENEFAGGVSDLSSLELLLA